MKRIIYAMQFKGKAGPGPSANVMKASTGRSSSTLATVVGAEGVQGNDRAGGPGEGGVRVGQGEGTGRREVVFHMCIEKSVDRAAIGSHSCFRWHHE